MNRRNFFKRTAQAAVMAFALSPLGKLATALVPKPDTFTFTIPELNKENLALLFKEADFPEGFPYLESKPAYPDLADAFQIYMEDAGGKAMRKNMEPFLR